LFSYKEWDSLIKGLGLSYIITGLIIIAAIVKKNVSKENFKSLILFLSFYPFVTSCASLIIYGQPLMDSVKGLIPNLTWLFYFVLNRYNFKEIVIIKVLLLYSLIMLAIMIIQQFTYPDALFGIMNDEAMIEYGRKEDVETRNGLYRFLIHQNGYTAVPVLLFYLTLLKNHFKTKYMIVAFTMIVAVYLSLTRQVMVSCLFVVIVSVISSNKNNKRGLKIWYFVIIILITYLIYVFSDALFGEIVETTKEHMDSDYIRVFAYIFYWEKICENGLTFILGHGIARSGSFLDQFYYWQEELHLYSCDIGIIGIWFHFGIVYVLIYLYSLYKIFNYRKKLPSYIILFTVYTALMSIMIFPFWYTPPKNFFIWSLIFYICDCHINKARYLSKDGKSID
jgi:hypothetical protein